MVRKIALLGAMTLALTSALTTLVEAGPFGRSWGRVYNPPGVGGTRPWTQSRPPEPPPTGYNVGQRNSLSPTFNSSAAPRR